MTNTKEKRAHKYFIDVEKIKEYIKDNNLTKKAFAEKCQINVWNLNRVLNGKITQLSTF